MLLYSLKLDIIKYHCIFSILNILFYIVTSDNLFEEWRLFHLWFAWISVKKTTSTAKQGIPDNMVFNLNNKSFAST